METKFTKGVWEFSPMCGIQGHCLMAQVWDSNGFNLCSIDDRYGEEEATANAKLIAAAPDLFDALDNLLFLHGCEQEGIESGQPTKEQWLEAVDKGIEALKKATE